MRWKRGWETWAEAGCGRNLAQVSLSCSNPACAFPLRDGQGQSLPITTRQVTAEPDFVGLPCYLFLACRRRPVFLSSPGVETPVISDRHIQSTEYGYYVETSVEVAM